MQVVLVTGVHGVGKSTVIEEMAEQLEDDGVSYGAIDLDWLWWFDVPGLDQGSVDRVRIANVKAVVENYVKAGVQFLLLAGAINYEADLQELAKALPSPVSVVRLTLGLPDIQSRLASAVTTGRQNDLRQTEEWMSGDFGADIADLVVANDRPVQVVATQILKWLGWS